MSTFETIDKNKVKITFGVDAARFEEGIEDAYKKNRNKITIQGFRKGKAPRKLIESVYGKGVFYDDAINFVLPDAYESAVKENDLAVVSRPEIDVTKIDDEGVEFTAVVFVKPEVTVGEYKGLEFTAVATEPTEEEIDGYIKRELQKNARTLDITDRPVANGDIAVIDFKGFVDDVAFEGGQAENYELEIGSHSFIDTFEEQLVGKNIGDEVKVNVTFPEQYGQADLAGKPAVFEVKINSIKFKELPELNDDFVQDVTEFETVEDYKNSVKEKLTASKTREANDSKESQLLDALVERCEMDVPEVMIENDVEMKISDFERNISAQGLTLENYLSYMGQDIESMKAAYRPISAKQVKARLALEAVAAKENFEVTDDDIKAETEKIAKAYNMDADKLTSVLRDEDKKNMTNDIRVQKALEFIKENAVEVEAKAE
ncbi:MAG TPA: trigger factor [Lachnospiraceae bacterium]|nr:trigger factor [Lachnospiraceae bacterium]